MGLASLRSVKKIVHRFRHTDEWLALHPGCFTSVERTPGTHRYLGFHREWNSDSLIVKPYSSHFTR
jgi:hypothetical protein